jgi:hypothetical protein
MSKPRSVKNIIPLRSGEIKVYSSPRVADAFSIIMDDMTLYKGVRLTQLLEAVYKQGQKDGRAEAVASFDAKFNEAQKSLDYRNPGQPKKRK